MSEWQQVREDNLPELEEIVWLFDGERIWVGGRTDDPEGWLWGDTYGDFWTIKENGVLRWIGNLVTDDDYKPTLWMPLPVHPKERKSAE